MTTITAHVLRDIKTDVLLALKDVEARHGVKFSFGTSHYTNGPTGDAKLLFASVDAGTGDVKLDPLVTRMMGYGDLTDEWCRWPTVGRQPGQAGAWKITGYNSRAPKYPWVVTQRDTGKTFRLPESLAKRLFGRATRIPFDPPKVTAPPVAETVQVTEAAPKTPARSYEPSF